jgi:nitrite reductase/ring-hydroxylating ferredoxin subunit
MSWSDSISLSSLAAGHTTVFKQAPHQVAIVRTVDGEVFAIDNRCPHEGYPLAEGTVAGCVLTCNWHNYKFDLRDGSCVMGEEAVRSYPTRIVDGRIEVDLSEPDPAEAIERLWRSMDEGMFDHQMGRVARDVVRLIQLGVPAKSIAAYSARWDALRAEYGSSHALPVAADIIHWFPQFGGAQAAIPLVQALDISARTHIRRPERARPVAIDPGDDPHTAGDRVVAAIEDEDADLAEGLIRGAIQRGWGPSEIEPWLFRAVSAHFLDFGHQLIYLIKMMELLERVGPEHADPIIGSYVFGLVNGTREDLLPEWRSLNKHMSALNNEWDSLYTASTTAADSDWAGAEALANAVLDGRRSEAFSALTEALRNRAPIQSIIGALSEAAGHRMIRFDVTHDANVGVQDSWLSVTHIQTYMAALRHAADRFDHPDLLRLVFFGAMFCHKGKGLDKSEGDRFDLQPSAHNGLEALVSAITEKHTEAAIQATAAWLASGDDITPLKNALMALCVHDAVVRPIVVAHLIKNTVVGFEEHADSGSHTPLLALIALFASAMSERRIHRVTSEAIAFVTQGKVPRSIM